MQHFRDNKAVNIIHSLPGCTEKHCIKRNAEREVTLVNGVYVKSDRPKNLFRKLRNRLRPKVKIEYERALALEKAGVPVVEMLGFQQCGSQGKLFSKAENGAKNAGEYWFTVQPSGTAEDKFLDALAELIKKIFAGYFHHSDFHFGNLLYVEESAKMLLVDPYETRKVKRLNEKQKLRMLEIVAETRMTINDAKAAQLIVNCGYRSDPNDALAFWHEMLRRAYRKARKTWPKRSRQIMHSYSKYVESGIYGAGMFRLRKMPFAGTTPTPTILESQLAAGTLIKREVSEKQARQMWLKSYFYEYLGFRCQRCMAWEQNNGRNILYLETLRKLDPQSCNKKAVSQFMNHVGLAGLDISPLQLMQTADARVALSLR